MPVQVEERRLERTFAVPLETFMGQVLRGKLAARAGYTSLMNTPA
jgi:hypothetical protein